MAHDNDVLASILDAVDLGVSVAELDNLLENARVETSAFTDLLHDRVDLIPGTKGSGKSALYRILVDFLPDHLLEQRKVVIAHGVQRAGDQVFQVFTNRFKQMDEEAFVDFWCLYLVSLANERFVKQEKYGRYFRDCAQELRAFRAACQAARIPEFESPKSLREVLDWAIDAVKFWQPRVTYTPPGDSGEFTLHLFGERRKPVRDKRSHDSQVPPKYVAEIRDRLERLLRKAGLNLWLMIDRLDEVFPRRSAVETRALRGLLRTLRIFESKEIRVKVFLRDDILDQICSGGRGFTALTHVTARQADTLKWSETQIMTMIVKRLFLSDRLADYVSVDRERLAANQDYREEAFYKVFPPKVHRGSNQSPTLRWLYSHTQDGNGVVTPRDVIDLVTKAKQRQQEECNSNPSGESPDVIGSAAILYGLSQLSQRKSETYLQAEFPHLWPKIKRFVGGKTEYSERAIRRLFEREWRQVVEDLCSVGVLRTERRRRDGSRSYKIPFLYRDGLELTQGKVP